MDIASATLLGQTPTIQIRPAAKAVEAPANTGDGPNAQPNFWHRAFGKDGFSFSTVLDIVNPLQHIPIVSTIYQKLTGDVASPAANIIGGALFGGPIGFAVASADTALKSETGKDMGGHVFALFDSPPATPTATMLADTKPPEAVSVATGDDAESPQVLADTPTLKVPTEIAQSKTPSKDTHLAAANSTSIAKTNTPFAFVMNNRRTPANGVGGSFVPLESRASVTPAAWYSSAATLASDPIANAVKPVAKTDTSKVSFTPPDLKTLAANPDQINQLKRNGMRPQAAKPVANPINPAATNPAPMPGAAASSLAPVTSNGINTADPASGDQGSTDGYASLMARNLERYMALQNKRSGPAKVNQAF